MPTDGTEWNGLKRKPLPRGKTQLRRSAISKAPVSRSAQANNSTLKRSTKPIKKRSAKMQELYTRERIPFVKKLLSERPNCEIVWNDRCTHRSTEVHEWILRSQGGAIVPGDKATRQGQRFFTTCHNCHSNVTDHPNEAARRDFRYSRKYWATHAED